MFGRIVAWLRAHGLEMHTPRAATQTYVIPKRRRHKHSGGIGLPSHLWVRVE
jgi:hypothetical protein